ncbi:hypothetical protein SLEP1_g45525 [Rubroshorea leprosula]|nr:hypothetical protein SLEP1_g45525 [Rubroshorea leprosula]
MREEEIEDNNAENIELEGEQDLKYERDNISAQSTLGPNNRDSPSSSINPLSTTRINPSLVQVAQEEPASAESSQEPIRVQVTQKEPNLAKSSQEPIGVPPPSHNATSASTHPMMTRTRIGTHIGHVKTSFPKYANTMVTNNNSYLNNAGMDIREPETIKKALQLPQWLRAMQEELAALYKSNTWTLVPPSSTNTNIVGSKWVFKTKLNSYGSVDKFKARLVARGFSQVPGVDFKKTFSPVLKPTILWLVIALATTLSWPLRQLDVKNAFLHGQLKEVVYMKQPPRFEDPNHPSYVCKLNKSIYGLKQAPRVGFDTFTLHLLKLGLHCSQANSSLFFFHNGQDTTLLLLYMDDIVLTASSSSLLQHIIENLSNKFALKDLGFLSYFLGIEVTLFSGGIFLSQAKYAKDILPRATMVEASMIATPMVVKEPHTPRDEDPVDAQEYRKIVGALQYLTITRANLCFAVNKKQSTLARSTVEAEYRALATTTVELVWITYLLHDIGISLLNPPQVFSNNISALRMAINLVFHARTKHIELDCHFVLEKFQFLRFKLGLVVSPQSSLRGSVKEVESTTELTSKESRPHKESGPQPTKETTKAYMKLVQYFLNDTLVLEKLTIHITGGEQHSKNDLLSLPMASKECQVVIL